MSNMTARIPRTWIASAAHNSALPFLYHTRTLTIPLCYSLRKAAQPRLRYSTSNLRSEDPDLKQDGKEESSQTAESTTTPASDDAPARTVNNESKTRAVNNYLQRRTPRASPSPPLPRRTSKPYTLTRGEKAVFGDLLEQLQTYRKDKAEAKPANNTGTETEAGKKNSSPTGDHSPNDEDGSELSQISTIFDSVLKDLKKKKKSPPPRSTGDISASSDLGSEATKTWQQQQQEGSAVNEKLWRFQQGAVDFTALENDPDIPTEKIIGSIVHRESAKIEQALRTAIAEGKEDIAIWGICKGRIFSMLQYLGDKNPEAESGLRHAMGMADNSEPLQTHHDDDPDQHQADHSSSGDPLEIPTTVLTEPVITALYPKVLLIAFRLLNSHFPKSPLIGQFRATIKSHGRTSAVLGTSTGLYNELIYFYWRGCNDLPAVVSLLHEMEVTGVEPDQRTVVLLNTILDQRTRDLERHRRKARSGGRHSARDPWWDMAPNRKAVRELLGPDGWVSRVEERVQVLVQGRDEDW